MTTFLYIVIVVLVLFVIGDILMNVLDGNKKRYKDETPVDPITQDDGSCIDEDIAAAEANNNEEHETDGSSESDEETESASVQEDASLGKDSKEEADGDISEGLAGEKTDDNKEEKSAVSSVSDAVANEAGAEESSSTTAVEPEGLLSSPKGGKADNLTRIKGIGVKIEEKLNKIGVWHFSQIAAWTEENLEWADNALSFRGRAKRDDWIGQAKMLADGKETEFSKRVDKGEVSSSHKS